MTLFIGFFSYPTKTDIENCVERSFLFFLSAPYRGKRVILKNECTISLQDFMRVPIRRKKVQKVKVESMHSATILPINEALSLNEVELKMS